MRDILKSLVEIIDATNNLDQISETLTAVATFVNSMTVKTYPPETILCHENHHEDIFYIIVDGLVHITKQIAENQPKQFLEARKRGQFFGEMALILDKPRTADVKTIQQSTMLEIDRTSFKEALEKSPVLEELFTSETIRNLDNHIKQEKIENISQNVAPQTIQVFTSYSHENSEFIYQLVQDLNSNLDPTIVKIWLDKKDIQVGKVWSRAVEKALEESTAMLLILSDAAVRSDNVHDEWHYYLEEKKPIIPILMEPCRIPYQLRRLQHVNFTEDSRKIALTRVHSALLDILPIHN